MRGKLEDDNTLMTLGKIVAVTTMALVCQISVNWQGLAVNNGQISVTLLGQTNDKFWFCKCVET